MTIAITFGKQNRSRKSNAKVAEFRGVGFMGGMFNDGTQVVIEGRQSDGTEIAIALDDWGDIRRLSNRLNDLLNNYQHRSLDSLDKD